MKSYMLKQETQSSTNLILNDRIGNKIAIQGMRTKHEKKKRMKLQKTNKIYKSTQTKKIKRIRIKFERLKTEGRQK